MVGGGEVGVEATFAYGEDSGVCGEGAQKPQIGWCGGKDIPRVDADGIVIAGKQCGGAAGVQDWSGGRELAGNGGREPGRAGGRELGGAGACELGGARVLGGAGACELHRSGAGVRGASRGCWGWRGIWDGLEGSGWGLGLSNINGVDIDYGVVFEPMGVGVYHGWMVSTMAWAFEPVGGVEDGWMKGTWEEPGLEGREGLRG